MHGTDTNMGDRGLIQPFDGLLCICFVYSDDQNAHTWVVPVLVHLLTGKT